MLDEKDLQAIGALIDTKLDTRLLAMESRMDKRFETLEETMDIRFQDMKEYVDESIHKSENMILKQLGLVQESLQNQIDYLKAS